MSSTNLASSSTSIVVPLARDEQGRPLPIPADAAFWRVRRHTRGRPRNVTGADRQPLRLPLDFTEADLEAMFGSGTYRLDLCDAAGEALDVTATISLGESEAPPVEAANTELEPQSALPVSGSDIRLVLEANVRATQLAFTHNERTLTASLRMADTLRDGLRDLANAQASWITAIASARGFFRNAPPALPLPATQVEPEDDEVEEDEPPPPPSWVEMAQPLVATITDSAVKAFMNRGAKKDGSAKGFELGDALDWRRAAKKAEENALAAGDMPPSTEDVTEQIQRKAMEVFARLEKPEQARLLALVPKLAGRASDPEMQRIAAELLPLPPDEATAWVRAHLDEIERRFAS
jgi:hypothetical protein